MKKFQINDLLKQIIIINRNINPADKEKLIKQIKYKEVTSLQGVKIIEGILNYGVILSEEQIESLPYVDCKRLNTALYLIIKCYKIMDIESLNEALDSMLTINIDEITGGFYERDTIADVSAVNDIIDGYVLASKPLEDDDYNIGNDEISIDKIKINYGNKEMIREFNRELFS
ncbi:hypothetical protein [Clostridium sp.]|uniref:hypothetical protein n=1 Tax=Clostridium sp. TaxID=1506 RepID=UPI0026DBBBAE|nr:hypothetical protein [Clostridium sp.]MDO5039717.1 hypothetical protein [Clostridium sp.]